MTRGADLLVQTLKRAGVRRVFTLSGNHVMPVFDALWGSGIGLVHVRHEAAAVHMADAWARLTGEVGVALVTGGPGHANALSALYTAALAEAPVLLLSGHAALAQAGRGAFQEMPQAAAAAPLCKPGGAWTARSAGTLADDVQRALDLAVSGRPGPVHLSLPQDVLEAEAGAPATSPSPASPPAAGTLPGAAGGPGNEARPELPAADAARLLAWLAGARRPLVLAGPWALTPAGRAEAASLQAALGVPVVGMESPRGVADPSLGDFAAVLVAADAVLLLAKRLDFTVRFGAAGPGGAFAPQARIAQLDPDADELARTQRTLGERLHASAQAAALGALRALRAQASGPIGPPEWLEHVREALAWRPAAWAEARGGAPDRLHPVQALRPLQALLDSHPRSILVSDGGEFGQWAQAVLHAPRRVINGVAGAIGAALPFALAARLAEPEAPIVAVSGDGSLGFHLAELDTAVRHAAAFVTVVGNDARWNAEHQIQLRDYGAARAHGCELLPTRYDLVAAAFGGHGECVTAAAQMPAALARASQAVAAGRPALINVMIEGLAAPVLRRP